MLVMVAVATAGMVAAHVALCPTLGAFAARHMLVVDDDLLCHLVALVSNCWSAARF